MFNIARARGVSGVCWYDGTVVRVLRCGDLIGDEDSTCQCVEKGVDPAAGCEQRARDAEEDIRHGRTGHGDHAADCDGECENDVDSWVHDHEFCCASELGGVIVDDASDAAAQVDEDVSIDGYCAEFDDKNPQVVEAFVLEVIRDPTLDDLSGFGDFDRFAHCLPSLRLVRRSDSDT